MSAINGFNLFNKNKSFVHNQVDVDEIFGEKRPDKDKKQKLPGWNPDDASAVYEPAKKGTAPVTYEKPASVIKKNDSSVQLSDAAKALLEELKAKYGDTDFVIANYSSDEEAQSLMAGGHKEYTVLIEPEILEQMAADESVKEQYLNEIDSAKEQVSSMMEELGDDGKNVESVGISIKADGTISYFAKMREDSDARSKELQEDLKERREEKKLQQKKAEKERIDKKNEKERIETRPEKENLKKEPVKTYTLNADSIEDLIAQIKDTYK